MHLEWSFDITLFSRTGLNLHQRTEKLRITFTKWDLQKIVVILEKLKNDCFPLSNTVDDMRNFFDTELQVIFYTRWILKLIAQYLVLARAKAYWMFMWSHCGCLIINKINTACKLCAARMCRKLALGRKCNNCVSYDVTHFQWNHFEQMPWK